MTLWLSVIDEAPSALTTGSTQFWQQSIRRRERAFYEEGRCQNAAKAVLDRYPGQELCIQGLYTVFHVYLVHT